MTFEEINNITKVNKDKEFMPVNNVDMILKEIKDRAIGDCYTNGETLIHRLEDIVYICDLFLVKEYR